MALHLQMLLSQLFCCIALLQLPLLLQLLPLRCSLHVPLLLLLSLLLLLPADAAAVAAAGNAVIAAGCCIGCCLLLLPCRLLPFSA